MPFQPFTPPPGDETPEPPSLVTQASRWGMNTEGPGVVSGPLPQPPEEYVHPVRQVAQGARDGVRQGSLFVVWFLGTAGFTSAGVVFGFFLGRLGG